MTPPLPEILTLTRTIFPLRHALLSCKLPVDAVAYQIGTETALTEDVGLNTRDVVMPFFRRMGIATIGDTMKSLIRKRNPWPGEWFLIAALFLPSALNAQKNDVMGQIQFEGKSSIDKDSGVWVDGEYVGYLQ